MSFCVWLISLNIISLRFIHGVACVRIALFLKAACVAFESCVNSTGFHPLHQFTLKIHKGFPGGAVVKNPRANAGDTDSSPGPGRSHMPRSKARAPQLLKPARLEPVLRSKRSHHNEKPAHHMEEEPLLSATRGSPRPATKTQRSQN